MTQQADIAFDRMLAYLPRDKYVAIRSSPKRIILFNHAVIWFKSGDKPDSLYGDDVHAAVIDEASRFKASAWEAVRTTLTYTQGPARIIGNVKGRHNWFYALARRAEQGERDLAYHRMTAYDAVQAHVLAEDEIAAAKREMSDRAFRELYLAEAADDGGNPFGIDHIENCTADMSDDAPVHFGIDLGKQVDHTVVVGLDRSGALASFLRLPLKMPWWRIKSEITRRVESASAFVDSTGVGDFAIDELQREAGSNYVGYKFTPKSKQQLMEGLQMALQERVITYPDKRGDMLVNDPGHIRLELEQYEYVYTRTGCTYSAPEGMHDDCVCALALAVACKVANAGVDVWERL